MSVFERLSPYSGVVQPLDVLYLALMVAFLIVVLWLFASSTQQRTVVKPLRVLTQIECPSCGFKEVRAFKEGDYVHSPSGPCRKCGRETIITGIYTEERIEE